MSLADSGAAWCVMLNLPDDTTSATIESKTNFLRPVLGGFVESVSRPLHVGRSMIVVDSDLRAESGKLIGRVTQTHPVLPRPKAGDGPRRPDLEENVGSRSVST